MLGYDNLKAYEKGSFYGATVGRVANRIAGAKFTLDGKEYKLTGNIHGGKRGFNKVFGKRSRCPAKTPSASAISAPTAKRAIRAT